ncbi:hypothetical protein D3C75_226480 [compost metagenome]
MHDLGSDNNLWRQYIDILRNFTAVLMAAGIEECLVKRKSVPYELRNIAVARADEIFLLKSELAADHCRFLSRCWSIEAKAALATQVNSTVVPGAGENHAVSNFFQLIVGKRRHLVFVDHFSSRGKDRKSLYILRINFVRNFTHYLHLSKNI